MDNGHDLPTSFFIQMGEMVNATKANTDAISKLTDAMSELVADHRAQVGEFRDFKAGLSETHKDISDLRAEVRALTSAIALDDESKKDFQYLRRTREEAAERRPMLRYVLIYALSATLVGAIGWASHAIFDAAQMELRK